MNAKQDRIRRRALGALLLPAALAACEARPGEPVRLSANEAALPAPTDEAASVTTANAELIDLEGRTIGRVTLEQVVGGVFVTGSVEGQSEGAHGFHFHEVGRCEPPFETAGAHFNPRARQHGLRNPEGPHAGDLPNVHVGADGTGRIEMLAPLVELRAGANALLDGDGTALILHASADDHRTDPSGDSGARIACGVLR
jgi:superoxide dismutase, Cu-Zn family